MRENPVDLIPSEMLEHAKVVDAVKCPGVKWQIEDISMTHFERSGIVSLVDVQCRRRDIDSRDLHTTVKRDVHLSAAAAGVKKMRSLREITKHRALELAL